MIIINIPMEAVQGCGGGVDVSFHNTVQCNSLAC